jgi:hypothetical protein
MSSRVALYTTNLALLTTHQVDAAYWQEWDVFGVPGGITFFLAFHLAAVAVLLAGSTAVTTGHRSAGACALLGASTGLVTCALHAVFLAQDPVAFWSPASLVILGGILVVSAALLWRELAPPLGSTPR